MIMDRDRKLNGRLGVGGDFYQVDLMDSKFFPLSSSSSSSPSPPHHSLPISYSSPSSSPPGGGCVGVGGVGAGLSYIEHTVSKMDTLAGVAIKYGVEVADIKRMNNLVTDLQMFALKTLQIPLPGRHPPSPILSNGFDAPGQGASCSEQTPLPRRHSDLFGSFQSLKLKSSSPHQNVSSAMSTLQGYYGLKTTNQREASNGCEMAVYQQGAAHYLEDGPLAKTFANSPLGLHRKCKSVANGFMKENGEVADILTGDYKEGEKLVRRRQKSEADFTSRTPELLLKEDNNSGSGLASRTGKGLALRQKAASRNALAANGEASWGNPILIGLGDSIVADSSDGVRKSSSTSNLQEQESSISSIWPTSKWSLKEDLQALSSAAITLPIFDGLPKPISGRRNKTALD